MPLSTTPITVSLDYACHAPDGSSTGLRMCYLTGKDNVGNRLFQVACGFLKFAPGNKNDGQVVGLMGTGFNAVKILRSCNKQI